MWNTHTTHSLVSETEKLYLSHDGNFVQPVSYHSTGVEKINLDKTEKGNKFINEIEKLLRLNKIRVQQTRSWQ